MTAGPSVYTYFQPTRLIRSSLLNGRSVMLIAPVGSRVGTLLSETASHMEATPGCQVVRLELAYLLDGLVDIPALWAQIAKRLKYKPKAVVRTAVELGILLTSYFAARDEGAQVVLVITGVRSSAAQHVYELIGELHSRQAELQARRRILQFVLSDHFALLFHMKRSLPLEESELYLMDQIETPVFGVAEIASVLEQMRADRHIEFDVATVAKSLHRATGGHYSLLMLAVEQLMSLDFRVDSSFWQNDIGRVFEGSDVVKKLRQALWEDREGIVETALKYTEGLPHQDFQSPRTMKLRTLGALYLTPDYRLKLCGGFVRQLLEAVGSENTMEHRTLGTFQTTWGLAAYEGGELKLSDEDLVILHISDLHVGGEHAFKLPGTSRRVPGDRGTLGEYIQRDLERMGVLDHVDGLLVSGDITCRADSAEFARAEDVLADIVRLAGVPANRVALVPGNHDIQWQPSEYSQRNGVNEATSRENFDHFYRHIVGRLPMFPEVAIFTSRDASAAIDLICLDSNHVEGPEAAGVGMIDPDALRAVGENLAQARRGDGDTQRRTVWLMSHHHYMPVCDVDVTDAAKRKVSVMGNASQVLDVARNLDVEVILHGHQHQPFLCHASRWMGSTERSRLRPILMVGAGSVGAAREYLGPISKNHYFLLIRQKDRLIIRSRKFGDEGLNFMPQDDFVFSRPDE